jgi:hypothetical protein
MPPTEWKHVHTVRLGGPGLCGTPESHRGEREGTEMDKTNQPPADPTAEHRRHGSPEGKVIGAFAPSTVEAVTAGLVAVGFSPDQIDVLMAADVEELDVPIDRPGLGGAISRFLFSLGDDLDELERARQEIANGDVLVGVPAEGSENVHRVRDVMRDHGGHGIIHYGRWAITTFD